MKILGIDDNEDIGLWLKNQQMVLLKGFEIIFWEGLELKKKEVMGLRVRD